MDYQFACVLQLLVVYAALAKSIGRDLILTPHQGLQVNGKSIYYAEERTDALHKRMPIPWERTLKHVSFVTIFTSAAVEAAAGNLSKLREYNNFLQSPYNRQNESNNQRFGDIVTLASGRLEASGSGNNTFRFVEGACDYQCQERRGVIALWKVQKIRHRDTHRTYRYEMKYSVSPLHVKPDNTGAETRWNENNVPYSSTRIYIQKDDDYPQNFGFLNYAAEQSFAERRLDDYGGRSFRQVPIPPSADDYNRQLTPMPESTFLRGSFLPPPATLVHAMPSSKRLNIGEYISSDSAVKITPKFELYPNPGSRIAYHAPTTFRPTYNLRAAKPETYQQATYKNGAIKFPENDQQTYNSVLSAPLVTHHFHHHFYMAPGGDGNLGSAEQQLSSPIAANYKPVREEQEPGAVVTHQLPVTYFENLNEYEKPYTQHMPPAPQKISLPITSVQLNDEQPQLIKQHLVHLATSVPPLRKPQIYQMLPPINVETKIPLFIYPAPVEEQLSEISVVTQRSNNKPFVQSELLDLSTIRYSEPDPLYVQAAESNTPPQLKAPSSQQGVQNVRGDSTTEPAASNESNSEPADSINAQLPSPVKGQEVRVPYVEDTEHIKDKSGELTLKDTQQKHENDQQQISSLRNIKFSTEKTSASTVKTEATPTIKPSSVTVKTDSETQLNTVKAEADITTELSIEKTYSLSETDLSIEKTEAPSITEENIVTENTRTEEKVLSTSITVVTPSMQEILNATNAITQNSNMNAFVSTSTTLSPLLLLVARKRQAAQMSATTEKPVLKWKPRRQENNSVRAKKELQNFTKDGPENEDQTAPGVQNSTNPLIPRDKEDNEIVLSEIFEVLTQKSVSKSVSIKIGDNGEEIPIIEDDTENMVQKKWTN